MAKVFGIDSKVRDWYMDAFPGDVLRKSINEDISFRDIVESLNRNENPVYKLGVYDSLIRERIFGRTAVISGVSYDVVYNKWMLGDKAVDIPLKEAV